jgi:large subunit ribosomal protein L6
MEIPTGVNVKVEPGRITVRGPKGEVSAPFKTREAKVTLKGSELEVEAEKRLANTILSHVRNMILGVTQGYSKKLKALYSHFPLSMEVKGKEVMIKNFLGEKQPRKVNIVGATKVEVKGQEMTVWGPSKEDVGQTLANIKTATKIKNRDHRVFQDGLYAVAEL